MRKNLSIIGLSMVLSQVAVATSRDLEFIKNPFFDMFHCLEDRYAPKAKKEMPKQQA